MNVRPKYSLIEFERRWIVRKEMIPDLSELERIEIYDKYFPDTRMRLRKMVNTLTNITDYKLTKKYGKTSAVSEPLTTIYLSETEYFLFSRQDGFELRKTIFRYPFSGNIFLLEFFRYPELNIILAEAESSSEKELSRLAIPDFTEREVTSEKMYEGYSIAAGNVI
ncbi:MAG: hypothetical protein IPM38_16650 [Ignavibacteria bacterium]|nr:hypothetical protein [Ignavibacteria bacterium]